MVYKSF